MSGQDEAEGRDPAQSEDGLGEVIEQLIDEQGAQNATGSNHESSPFAQDHDRIFKAFGE